MDCWLNIYKPKNISSAKVVSYIKRAFKGQKVGHAGTLDLEAEGILPIAFGEATKLIGILMDAKKQYQFTIQFGAKTDTADSAGKVIKTCDYIPTKEQCVNICSKFTGEVSQQPPIYSALKVDGKRAYDLARQGISFSLAKRNIYIYNLICTDYNKKTAIASYECTCSKGTYIRTLAEDIALSLQSLGFVIELRRTRVGMFKLDNSINISDLEQIPSVTLKDLLIGKSLKIETVLDDIPVLEADDLQAQKIRYGQPCIFDDQKDLNQVWVRNGGQLVAIGKLESINFKSLRVFNCKN